MGMRHDVSWVLVWQARHDAIGIYTRELIRHLPKQASTMQVCSELTGLRWIDRGVNILHSLFLLPLLALRRPVFIDPKTIEALLVLVLRRKAVFIFHHHERDPPFYRLLPGFSLGTLLRQAGHVVAISGAARDQAISLGVDEARLSVCYSGVDQSIFKPRNAIGSGMGRYILHVGSDIPRKNTVRALKAFAILAAQFDDLRFLKVGNDQANRLRMKTLVEALGMKDRVEFRDSVTAEELAELYTGAECLLFPSLLEGFGFPVVEAMACGCPVVTSNRDPMRELVDGCQILCDPESTEDIAAACRRVLSDPALRAQMSASGIVQARKFSWERTASGINEVVQGRAHADL